GLLLAWAWMRSGRSGEALGQARIKRAELQDEVPGHEQSAQGEDHVTGQAHPLPEQCAVVELDTACVGQSMLKHRAELGPADREEIQADPKHQTSVIEPESPDPQPFIERRLLSGDVAQTEIH